MDVRFLGCELHIFNLMFTDLMKNTYFATMQAPAIALSEFFRGSDKRMQALLEQQVLMGIARPLRVMSHSPTRFMLVILVMKRVVDLWPVSNALYARVAAPAPAMRVLDTETATKFNLLYGNLLMRMTAMTQVVAMLRPLLEFAPMLGSSSDYTTSITRFMFVKLREQMLPYTSSEHEEVKSIAISMLGAALKRMAPVAFIENAQLLPEGLAPIKLKPAVRLKKLKRDGLYNLAAMLDPALWAHFRLLGYNVDDAEAEGYNLLKQCASITGGQPIVHVEGVISAAARKAGIAAIRAKPKE